MKVLTEELRAELKKPFGKIAGNGELALEARRGRPLVAVGDHCIASLLKAGVRPDIAVFDLKTKRLPVSQEIKGALEVFKSPIKIFSPPGYITPELERAVKKALKDGRGEILVEGEDDLAGLVVLAYAREGAVFVYGLPDVGAVVVHVTKKDNDKALSILNRMPEQ
jgi:GTP-dependent dephospho-CoA kinase